MKRKAIPLLCLVLPAMAAALLLDTGRGFGQSPVAAPGLSESDRAGIRNAALDYAMGWYEGNGERMERALHPELAKRIVRSDDQGRSRLDQMSALTLVQSTRRRAARPAPEVERQAEVVILDTFGNMAAVRAEMKDWVDYLHIAKYNGEWKIVNVLWDLKPRQP